jgi:hypothetical protein
VSLHFLVAGHDVWIPSAVALGVGVGLIAGMFGVGGGFLLVPLLHALLGIPLPQAVGAGLCQTIATALSSHLRHRGIGTAETRFDIMLLGGSVLGVDAGTRLLHMLEGVGTVVVAGEAVPTLRVVTTVGYAAIFVTMSWVLWSKPPAGEMTEIRPGPLARVPIPPYADLPTVGLAGVSGALVGMIGFANGIMAGLLGIGGGIVLIPIMLYGFGFDIRKAAGTGIVVVLAVSVVGTVHHALLGNVHLGLAATLIVGAALSAQIGASLTKTLSAAMLRRGLAVVLVITVVTLTVKLFE